MDTRVDVYEPKKIKVKPYEHHVKYYETDQMRIVHHSNYIRWMEEARMDMMEQMGFGYDKMEELEIISPVISVNCEYKSMVRFGETVVINGKVVSYNVVKLKFFYEMTDK